MNWFERLVTNPHIDTILLTDNQGQILRSSKAIPSQDELIASMIQAAEVLAQSLTTELERGPAQMLQISTDNEHLLIFPLALSTYNLVVIVQHAAPLLAITALVEEIIPEIDTSEFTQLRRPARRSSDKMDNDELNAEEIIAAVQEWLQGRSHGNSI